MTGLLVNEVSAIVQDAGGRIVGRTRLQKVAFLLTATGLDDNFRFSYKHYGPFSDELAHSAEIASLIGKISERQDRASWGGTYSTYSVDAPIVLDRTSARAMLASEAANADAIELELAATAVFLSAEGFDDPWGETARRKPEKSTSQRMANARALLARLRRIPVPVPLPNL